MRPKFYDFMEMQTIEGKPCLYEFGDIIYLDEIPKWLFYGPLPAPPEKGEEK